MESLENRQLMAGDVTAELFNGKLMISESVNNPGQASDISITKLTNGDIRVSANTNTGGHVNGQAYVDFRKLANTTNLSVNLGDGNDRLQMLGKLAFNQVDISMGRATSISGDADTVVIQGLTTLNQLNITTGDGVDNVKVRQARIGDGLGGIGGASDQLSIITGKGADIVNIGDLSSQMNIKGYLFVDTTSGPINLARNQTELGDDKVSINLLDVDGSADINMGGGQDTLDMLAVNTGQRILMGMGDGNDTVKMRDSVARNGLVARMGSGNDTLHLNNVDTLYANMDLDGGVGYDTLIRSYDSTTPSFMAYNWELPPAIKK